MKPLVNKIVSQYLWYRKRVTNKMLHHAHEAQNQIFRRLIKQGQDCSYGYKHYIKDVNNYEAFKQAFPISQYEDLAPHIEEMMLGKKKLLCKDKVSWFAKSSGTSNDRSKYIPVTNNYLFKNHIKGFWDNVTFIYDQTKNAKIFQRKNLLMGGSYQPFEKNPKVFVGDITGIMIQNIPPVGRPFYTPDFQTAMIQDWDKKIERISEICKNEDVTLAAGVPTWSLLLFEKILKKTGKKNMQEVWPNMMAYVHGGVNFEPYRTQFEAYFPKPGFEFLQGYNASEGFFALQDIYGRDDMLLLVDNENFFEFIPLEAYHNGTTEAIELKDVELNKDYVMMISNNSGMWRYVVGDTLKFTTTDPYRIKVTGRTTQFLNVFGEELMIHNVERGLAEVCNQFDTIINDYTIAPRFIDGVSKGRHEWYIEFKKAPKDITSFQYELDGVIKALNSDYAAKRKNDVALECLKIIVLKKGSFENWYRSKNKFGSQHKVPRLSNDRQVVNELCALNQNV